MKYPVGIQDFRALREGDYVYVDKTRHIYQLLTTGKYYFLSRPRRFGKSLLLSTMNELYSGSDKLFEGLWIEKRWGWEAMKRPVIWLRFASFKYKENPLDIAIRKGIAQEADRMGIELEEGSLVNPLEDLIHKAHKKFNQRVVLLIDEYDKPIIDYLEDHQQAETNRNTLKWLYSIVKDNDPKLELVFITGVSAFSKVSIFSDLNNLENLTLSRSAYTLAGITQQELSEYFPEQMQRAQPEKVKRWYNGYSWGSEEKLYNPFSILRFFKEEQRYHNFWFETGTPTFLIKEMKKGGYYDVSETLATSNDLNNFDLQHLNPVTVLFQTGYLTIRHYEEEDLVYTLDYPNIEVKHALQEVLLKEYLNYPQESPLPRVVKVRNALQTKDIETVVSVINSAFSEIPGELWQGQTEHFYHAVTHLIFSLLGTYIQSEVRSSRGRCDAIVQTDQYIYAIEFKLNKSVDEALQQIREKGYLAPYQDSPKQKLAIGFNFSSEKRSITDWKVEEYQKLK